MAITKQKKVELVASMKDRLSTAKSVVFVNFNALSVAETKALRRKLSAEQVGYVVAKKTLAKRVLNDMGAKGEMPELPGQIALAYGEDLLAPARETYEFQKTPRDKGSISIMGGIFDGEFKTQSEMMAIATIPPLQVLRGMFLNVINSPIARVTVALGQIAESKGAAPVAKAEEAAPVAAPEPVVEAPKAEEAVVSEEAATPVETPVEAPKEETPEATA
jgi:large subunit ribosomal protein L10